MAQCKTCCNKGYIGLKAHECLGGMPSNDRPCPDCSGSACGDASDKYRLVKLGGYRTSIDLRTQLNRAHCKMNFMAQDVLGNNVTVDIAPRIIDVHLNFLSLADLGMSGNCKYNNINDVILAGREKGSRFLPHEVVPQFRLKHRQPIPWRWLIFGTPTFRYNGNLCVFIITNNAEGYSLRVVQASSFLLSRYSPNNHSPNEVMTAWRN